MNRNSIGDGRIIFPDNPELKQQDRFNVPPVPICKSSTYCNDVVNYPSNIVEAALARNKELLNLVGSDIVCDIH